MWQTNGAGRKTSTAFGFGLLDAEEFVRLAEQWPPAIPQQRNCTYTWGGNECSLNVFFKRSLDFDLMSDNITDYRSNFYHLDKTRFGHKSSQTVSLRECTVNFVEHVRVKVKGRARNSSLESSRLIRVIYFLHYITKLDYIRKKNNRLKLKSNVFFYMEPYL